MSRQIKRETLLHKLDMTRSDAMEHLEMVGRPNILKKLERLFSLDVGRDLTEIRGLRQEMVRRFLPLISMLATTQLLDVIIDIRNTPHIESYVDVRCHQFEKVSSFSDGPGDQTTIHLMGSLDSGRMVDSYLTDDDEEVTGHDQTDSTT